MPAAAAAAAKVRARLLRHRRRSRRSNPPALEWMTRSVAAQRRGWVTFPSCSYRNSHIRLWRQNSSQDVDCGRPHHSTPAPLRAATLSTKLRDRRPPQSVCGVVRPSVRWSVVWSLPLSPSLPLSLPSPLKGAEGERAKERGLRPSRRRHRRVKAGQDGSRKEEEEEGPSDRGFPAP